MKIIQKRVFHLEPIGKESVVKKSMCNDELDHYNDEVKEFTKNKTTKIDIISEIEVKDDLRIFTNLQNLLIMNIPAKKLN